MLVGASEVRTPSPLSQTHRSHANSAATPTSAVRSPDFSALPVPGAVRLRSVERSSVAMGMAGCVAEGKKWVSSWRFDMVM